MDDAGQDWVAYQHRNVIHLDSAASPGLPAPELEGSVRRLFRGVAAVDGHQRGGLAEGHAHLEPGGVARLGFLGFFQPFLALFPVELLGDSTVWKFVSIPAGKTSSYFRRTYDCRGGK